RVEGAVLFFLFHRAGNQVMTICLAIVGIGRKFERCIRTRVAFRMRIIAGPWDSCATAEFVVGQAGIVAWPAARALLPSFERLFGRCPFDQRPPVLVPEIHSPRVIQENVEIAARLARWFDSLV